MPEFPGRCMLNWWGCFDRSPGHDVVNIGLATTPTTEIARYRQNRLAEGNYPNGQPQRNSGMLCGVK